MELAKGSLLSKTKLLNAEWYLDEILRQAKITYSLGIIHADLSEYNIFVSEEGVQLIDWPQYITLDHPQADEILERDVSNVLVHFYRKYDIKRELEEVIEEIKSGASLIEEAKEETSRDEASRDEEGNEESNKEEASMGEAIIERTGKRGKV
jgi:RIO kinase 2